MSDQTSLIVRERVRTSHRQALPPSVTSMVAGAFLILTALAVFPNPALGAIQCAGVSGLWFDPDLDGEGFNLLETDGGLIVTYYGYSSSGQRLWLISEIIPEDIDFDTDLEVNMLVGEGGQFQLPLPPAGLSTWGTLSLNFSDSSNGLFQLSGADGDKLSTVLKLAAVRDQQCTASPCTIDTGDADRLSFANDEALGIFDPSLDSESGSGAVWLSYSTVSTSLQWPQQNESVIQTRLAQSIDGGSSFSFVNEINPVLDVNLNLAPPNNAGTWVSEVSSLAHDPMADPEQRWKLIWHHYLQINGERHFEHGWLGYRTAARADQLKDADEIKLFGAGLYDPANDTAGGATQPPVAGAPLIDVRDLSPELANCAVLSEPGWLANNEALYLAVGCFQVSPFENRMILLACDQPCNATSPQAWRLVATLLVNANARALGFERFSAPDLFVINGDAYLWVSPVTDQPFSGSYNGCRAFQFTSLGSGTLQTDATGQPQPALVLNGLPNSFNGACALHMAAGNQAFYSQLALGVTDGFRIFRTPTESCFPDGH